MSMITTPGIYPEITTAQYFAEPCPAPALSNSAIQTLVSDTPFHVWSDHVALGAARSDVSTKAQRKGSLWHELALGNGRGVVIVSADDWRTKIAKEARDEAIADGKTPALEKEYDEAALIAKPISERLRFLAGTNNFTTETVFAWQRETSSGPIWCRAMADLIAVKTRTIVDLKTTTSLSTEALERRMMDYDTQDVFYQSGLSSIYPEWAGRTRFIFLFVESSAPYAMRAVEIPESWRETARPIIDRAAETFARCLKTAHWPSYPAEPERLDPPEWLIRKRLSALYSAENQHLQAA